MNLKAIKNFRMKISHSMIIAFLIMSSLLLILGVVAIIYTNRMQESTRKILEENVSSLKAAEELELALLEMKGLTAYFLLDDQSKWLDIFDDKKAAFLYWQREARKKTHSDAEVEILNTIDSLYSSYVDAQSRAVREARRGRKEAAHAILTADMFFIFDSIYNQCESLLLINEKLMFNTSSLIERDSITVNYVVYGMAFSSIIVGLGLGFLLSSRITHPIYNLVLRIQGATNEEKNIVELVNTDELTELEHLDASVQKLISKVRTANEELQKSEKMLIRSEKYTALGHLAAGVAHEIRNPLTAIKMLMNALQDEVDKASPIAPDIAVIIHEVKRIEKFIQDFLDFARPPKPNFKNLPMSEIIEPTIALLTPQLKLQRIDIEVQIATESATVHADAEQLKQVFLNILLNSIQAMPDGGLIQIQARCHQLGPNHPYLCICIKDTGPGIDPSLIQSLFDPFNTTKEDGTGLGLSIADQIIHAHAGWIEAQNAEPNGAVFSVYLPLIQQDTL